MFCCFCLQSWNRWGRVGENGQNNGLEAHTDAASAIKAFEKKFKDKSSNNWTNRANFTPVKGKYTLIEMDTGGDEEETTTVATTIESPIVYIYMHKQIYLYGV